MKKKMTLESEIIDRMDDQEVKISREMLVSAGLSSFS